nr:unnamed protein product [Digitaria exilis]
MTEPPRVSFRDGRLASRKAEEAAWRRHQAASWLQTMVGSFGLSPCPSEQEFVASLRNGIVLCRAINKVQPGAVPKVITNAPCDSQPLTAFQYFENIRNFLVAVQGLKLPTFEASDLDKIQSDNVALRPSPSQKHLVLTQADADTLPFQNGDPKTKGNIRVFCRIRPPLHLESISSIEHVGNDSSVMVCDPVKPQNEVYNETQPLIRSVMDGYNCGPSGGLLKDFGINYMALNDLFNISTSREDVKYDIRVQMVEIYNEQVRDLLIPDIDFTLDIRTPSNNVG